MKSPKYLILVIGMVFFLLNAPVVWADKSAVEIDAPNQVAKGSEVVITLKVIHSANNFFHYTEWVVVKANGEEIARWEYSAMDKPEGETFTKEVTVTADKDLEIEAQGNCNLHGSAGVSERIVFVK
ncbi:MAG: desulfoferrodoxin family protein [Deltaproteobacteria bacterium]|nr:desulfoferrodoxin family protein [Deltaproteobacteria bacterium]